MVSFKWFILFFEQCNYNQLTQSSKLMTNKYQKWTDYEDYVLAKLVQKLGKKNWSLIAKQMKNTYQIINKKGKQCRERWVNNLETTINNSKWTADQDFRLINLHAILGTKWKEIGKEFDNRSENSIKNHFHALIRKSIRKMCKYAHSMVKAAYEIKPMALSKIYMVGMGHADDDYCKKVSKNGEIDINSHFCYSKQQYLQMAKIINTFIFGNKESKMIDKPSKEKVNEIILKIMDVNLTMKIQNLDKKEKIQDQLLDGQIYFDSNYEKEQNCKQQQTEQKQLQVIEVADGIFSLKTISVKTQNIKQQHIQKLIQEFQLPFQHFKNSQKNSSLIQVNQSQPCEYYIYRNIEERFDAHQSDFTELKYYTTPRCKENTNIYDQMLE